MKVRVPRQYSFQAEVHEAEAERRDIQIWLHENDVRYLSIFPCVYRPLSPVAPRIKQWEVEIADEKQAALFLLRWG